jgi:hypothetical protein
MSSVFTKELSITNVESFKSSISDDKTRLYFTYGKSTPWANESDPLQANTTVKAFNEIWNNMIGGKLITGNDIKNVIPRYDWKANTVYTAYDDTYDILTSNSVFYVVTDEFNVYKCLSNNSGSISTVKPDSVIQNNFFQTNDEYIWKYMYTISAAERLRFTTDEYIPVKTITENDNSLQWNVQQAAVDGSLSSIVVTNPGSGYLDVNNITITITGDGENAAAIAQVNSLSNTISSITLVNQGRKYTRANVIITSSGSGSGATARAVLSPTGGHGSDAVSELGGSFLLINARIRGSENDLLETNHSYRQISIIKDPKLFVSDNVTTNTVFTELKTLTLTGTSVNYNENEIVYQGSSLANSTFNGTVVIWDDANNRIYLSNFRGDPTTDLLIGANSTASRFVTSITNPDLKYYSGKLLYTDNIKSIQRSEDQTEDFKIVLKF